MSLAKFISKATISILALSATVSLGVCGIVSAKGAGSTVDNSILQSSGDTYVINNGNFSLELKYDDLSFTLADNVSNIEYHSFCNDINEDNVNDKWLFFLTSGLIVGYKQVDGNKNYWFPYQNLNPRATITTSSSSITIALKLRKINISLQMIISLGKTGEVSIAIPYETIVEETPEEYLLMYLTPYPSFASTPGLKQGFMFLPDGSGAISDLSKKTVAKNAYSQRVYGTDIGIFGNKEVISMASGNPVKKALMPVYGISLADEGSFLASIDEGSEYANIIGSTAGITIDYNYASAQFNYREEYFKYVDAAGNGSTVLTDDKYVYDARLSFHPLGKNPSLAEMANTYRSSLLARGLLVKRKEDSGETGLRLQFLMSESKATMFGNSEITMTKISDIISLVKEFTDEGINKIDVSLLGYRSGGYSHTSYAGFSLSSGAKDGSLSSLASLLGKNGGSLSFDQDPALIRTSSSGYSSSDIAMTLSNKSTQYFDPLTYATDHSYTSRTMLNFNKISSNIKGDLRGISSLEASSVLDIDDISNTLFSSYHTFNASRGKIKADMGGLLASLGGKYNLASPSDYMLPYASKITNAPSSGSGFYLAPESVPFYEMVVSGDIECYSSPLNLNYDSSSVLKLVEYNLYPTFLLTNEDSINLFGTSSSYLFSSKISNWKDTVVTLQKKVKGALDQIYGSYPTKRENLASGLVKTTYSNGKEIYVNYSSSAYEEDGLSVPAEGFEIK